MNEGKAFKSYRQQIKILRNRGMYIPFGNDASKVIKVLERENYYNKVQHKS